MKSCQEGLEAYADGTWILIPPNKLIFSFSGSFSKLAKNQFVFPGGTRDFLTTDSTPSISIEVRFLF